MIKKILLAILIAFPFTAFSQVKIAVVDTQTLISALPETAKAQADLEAASKKYEAEFAKLQEEAQKAYKEYQELPADTPNAIRERREQAINELAQRMDKFHQDAQQDLARQQQALLAPIQAKIQNAIKEVGDEGTYTIILENMVPVYVGNSAEDVTAKVKSKLGL